MKNSNTRLTRECEERINAMTVTIHPTTKTVTINGLETRIWEGKTEGNDVPVFLFVARIATTPKENQAEFLEALQERQTPSPEAASFPLRLII